MKTFNRTRTNTYNDTVKVYELNKTVIIQSVTTGHEEHKISFFALKDDYKKALEKYDDVFVAIKNIEIKYQCYNKEFWDALNRYGFGSKDPDTLEMVWGDEYIIDPISVIELSDFNENELGYFYSDAHLMYTIGSGKNPLSIPYYVDYIGGVTNRNFDLDKALKILKASSYVSDIKEMRIPYYNADPDNNKAIQFRIKLPQDVYNKLCEYYRDTTKEKFWTCRVKDAVVWHDYYEADIDIDLDFIGLKSCWVENKVNY